MTELINNIKNLRKLTGAGFVDCKKALNENSNDIEKSIDFLRKKGLAKAFKKSSREANEGAIGIYTNDSKTIMVEINTETDFAAKNKIFLDFLDTIGQFTLTLDNEKNFQIENFNNLKFNDKLVSEYFSDIIAKIGENIVLKRISLFSKEPGYDIFSYTHNAYKPNVGKICVILKAKVDQINDESKQFGKNLCMHVAASKPIAIDKNDLDISLISKEKEVQLATIQSSGKTEDILNKILEGKMKKFYSEVILLNQPYIFDTNLSVEQVVSEFSKKNNFSISKFKLFMIGF